ncbi:MAG: ADOP family duplicated permease [Acidobacteriota bacterium]
MAPTPWDRFSSAMLALRFRLRSMFRQRETRREIAEELQFHLDARADAARASGLVADQARRRARLQFGNVHAIEERVAAQHRFVWWCELGRDVAHGFRLWRRTPVTSTIAVVVLALGIGINLWAFATLQALLFSPTPGVSAPDRLVIVGRTQRGAGFDLMSWPNFVSLAERANRVVDLSAYASAAVAIDYEGRSERARAQFVDGQFFPLLGVDIVRGRPLLDADDQPGALGAVVSAALWNRAFGPDADLSRVTIRVNRTVVPVIGVAAQVFRGVGEADAVDLWLPLASAPVLAPASAATPEARVDRSLSWMSAVGRLRPGVTMAQGRAVVRTIGETLATEFPAENLDAGLTAEALAGTVSAAGRDHVRQLWRLLWGFATLVLLVVCCNVSNLLLLRAAARMPEMALRSALGAGRIRLVRQVIAEHAGLALVGGVGGVTLASFGASLLASRVPLSLAALPQQGTMMDWHVLVVAAALVVVVGLLVSLPPALAASTRPSAGGRVSNQLRLRMLFAAIQVAASFALVVGALLFGRSLHRAASVDLGFEPRGLVTAYYDLGASGSGTSAGSGIPQQWLEMLTHQPGVISAALGAHVPLTGSSLGLPVDVWRDDGGSPEKRLVRLNVLTPGFFKTLGTPVLEGREFAATDGTAAPATALVNETCRRQCFGGQNPIGRRIQLFQETQPRTVVGVIADAKYSEPLEDVRPTVYVPFAQHDSARMALLVRTSLPADLVSRLPALAHAIDPGVPLYDIRTVEDRFNLALWPARLTSLVVTVFGAAGLLLAVLGVYGVVAESTRQRSTELAIRMALGATPRSVRNLILRQAAWLLLIGGTVGAGLAAVLAGLVRNQLYGVDPIDPVSFLAATLLLVVVSVAACLIPASRAAATSPAAVLRA